MYRSRLIVNSGRSKNKMLVEVRPKTTKQNEVGLGSMSRLAVENYILNDWLTIYIKPISGGSRF